MVLLKSARRKTQPGAYLIYFFFSTCATNDLTALRDMLVCVDAFHLYFCVFLFSKKDACSGELFLLLLYYW